MIFRIISPWKLLNCPVFIVCHFVAKEHSIRLYFQERQRERYQVIFFWKVSQCWSSSTTVLRGRLAVRYYKVKSLALVRRARDAFMSVQGSKLFNIIPWELRDMYHENVDWLIQIFLCILIKLCLTCQNR